MSVPSAVPDRSVVVVEDEALVRELAVCQLEDGGFRVIDFATADEALRYLSDHADETSVLFTDVQMPGRLNGLELVEIVSRQWPAIRVLVTSGGTLVNPVRLPASAGFVAKPWRASDILRRVQSLATAAIVRHGNPVIN